jgi:F-type H+-transporting ATPase subunit epsilon
MATAVDTDFAASTSKVDGKKSSHRIQCVVVTPERTLFDELVEFVALPLYDGELGVLPGRAPMVGRLGFGELRTSAQGTTKRYFVDGGFAQVRDNVVTILTNRAIAVALLNAEAAAKELEIAKALKGTGQQELTERTRAVERATAMIRVAGKS